ncbi:uncharacterized protein LOC110008562 isoform X2 [Amborella trichopoda]|uniref:uncharacterized protein LOC110008562 isoform X2 n=1 Tax=Amborella trichopoda TaxID=13333 RepID=UPI0009BD7CEB|nr:uncharacterized protein LOC110008562 isoform X2 [Amborella trichopoda]XP_020532266.1 uncharacterized protein LOC110008562 isoform X2 [Amborella trichopoda]|eukprot:XP_020532265.1 uncharacterized protein LOC110008562 isoform X2 [Amborella trichopoda]
MRHKRMGKKSKGLFRIGDQVEVRFLYEGLKGTWHPAEVSDYTESEWIVVYDRIKESGGSSWFVDHIPMSGSLPFLGSDSSSSSKNKRPRIRALYPPLSAPPSHENLVPGLCVDAFIEVCWCEGVIVESKSGCAEITVFFPDEACEQSISLSKIRITKDWDEFSRKWTDRGRWPLMTCLEKIQKKGSFLSLNQLWCQLSMKREFMQVVLEWTCTSKMTWEMLIDQVIGDAERERTEKQMRALVDDEEGMVAMECCRALDVSSHGSKTNGHSSYSANGLPLEYDSEHHSIDAGQVFEPTFLFPSYSTDELFSEYDSEHHSIDPGQVEEPTFQFPSYSTDELFSEYDSEHHWIDGAQEQESTYQFSSQSTHDDYSEKEEQKRCGKVTKRKRGSLDRGESTWEVINSGAAKQSHHYPDSITDYIEVRNNNGSRRGKGLIKHMKQTAVNHLLSAGWRLECKVCDKRYAFRYVSASGKAYYSLLQACMAYQEAGLSQRSCTIDELSSCGLTPLPQLSNSTEIRGKETLKLSNSIRRSSSTEDILSTGSTMALRSDVSIEQSFCPKDPLEEYKDNDQNLRASKQRKSLLYISGDQDLKAVYCPKILAEYVEVYKNSDLNQGQKLRMTKPMVTRVMEHLNSMGWSFPYKPKNSRFERRYISPRGRTYTSLITACKALELEREGH